MKSPIFRRIASALSAHQSCAKKCEDTDDSHWEEMADSHKDRLEALVSEHMPSGSGFDAGTSLDFDASTPDKLIFDTSFHHMKEGMYVKWTEHTVTVLPSLLHGFTVKVSGRNYDDIKEYIADTFHGHLATMIED